MSDNTTPTPWVGVSDQGKCISIMAAGRDAEVCSVRTSPRDADADLIITAVNNHAPMLKTLGYCASLFDVIAQTMDRWATETRNGAWSTTNQAEDNRKRAADCRRYAASIRAALPADDDKPRTQVVGRVTGKLRDGDQARGMPHAICHACGLGYKCADPDCPNEKPTPVFEIGRN